MGGVNLIDKYLEINLKNKDSLDKLDIIEELEVTNCNTADYYKLLDYLSNDEDYEVRAKVSEVLVAPNNSEADKILIKILRDKDELVRVNACDSLCTSNSYDVIKSLER